MAARQTDDAPRRRRRRTAEEKAPPAPANNDAAGDDATSLTAMLPDVEQLRSDHQKTTMALASGWKRLKEAGHNLSVAKLMAKLRRMAPTEAKAWLTAFDKARDELEVDRQIDAFDDTSNVTPIA